MIDEVFLEYSTYAEPPGRFEAGTPAIAECVGLGAACDYLEEIGMDRIEQYEHYMTKVLFEALEPIESINIYGPEPKADGSGSHKPQKLNPEPDPESLQQNSQS